METMDQLMERNWEAVDRIIRSQIRSWRVPAQEVEDVFQDVLTRILQYPPKVSKAKDPDKFFLSSVYTQARRVLLTRAGLHRGTVRSAKVEWEENIHPRGLFQLDLEGNTGLMDERILPPVASAEEVFFSKMPSRRQEALRGAIEGLPERQREALYLRTYEELSLAETAFRMGCTEKQVTQLTVLGTKKLKQRLNPMGA